MYYEQDEKGRLIIGAIAVDEQPVIEAIIAAIEAYKATFAKDEAYPEPDEKTY